MATDPRPYGSASILPLVAAARDGDLQALSRLVEALQPYVHQRVTRLLFSVQGRMETPSDVAQRVNMALLAGLKNFRGESERQFYGWLNSVIANRIFDHGRSRQAVQFFVSLSAQDSSDPTADVPCLRPTPCEIAHGNEMANILKAALTSLQPEYQDALRMVFFEGRKTADIAASLGITQNAFHQRLLRAKQALEPHLPPDIHDLF